MPEDTVCYQTLEFLEKRHQGPRQAIGKLSDIFKACLGATQIVLDNPAFLKSPSHAPQAAHIDFKDKDFLKCSKGKVFLAFVPLTLTGMFFQLWPEKGEPGRVLLIPFGKSLIVPGDTIHGGGFLSCPLTPNLRLHFYIRINDAVALNSQANDLMDETLYPQSDKLLNGGGGLLANLFEIKNIKEKRLRRDVKASSKKHKAN